MPKRILLFVFLLLLTISSHSFAQRAAVQPQVARIPAPAEVLGFTPGDDRKLASWAKTVEYFQKLDAASDRVKFEELGKTTMGAPFVMATISAPENLRRLNEFRKIQELLADPRKIDASQKRNTRFENSLGPSRMVLSARERIAKSLIADGKTIVLITCGIHSDEVGSSLSSMLIAHRLASSNEPEILNILQNTIVLLVPSLNPDGVDIVKNWYDKTLGTPYEGTDPPMLYNKYVGHDNNRDWYAFTQVETQIAVDKIHNVWHPQIVHDIHQQGANGSRLFLPPYMQPVEPNVPKQIVEGYTELGRAMAADMRAAGFKGITTDSTYDAWSPSRAYSHYHGGVRILSETASCKIATPTTVKFEELNSRQGYDPKKESANFGPLWKGGEWHLRDITNYMTAAAFSLLKHAARDRERWLERFYEIGKEAVRPRKNGELGAYVLAPTADGGQNIRRLRLAAILARAGVEMTLVDRRGNVLSLPAQKWRSESLTITFIIPTNQPYSAFARALLEPLRYPDQRDAAGHPIPPYDVTAQALSLLMDVEVKPMIQPFRLRDIKTSSAPNFFHAKGFTPAKLALYKSYNPAIDEGWTRWLLEQDLETKGFASVSDQDIRASLGLNKYDTIIIPDQARAVILNGHKAGAMPPEYTGGLGAEGVKALLAFVEKGGTLVCLNRASEFAIEQFKLPVRNVVAGIPRTDFYVPGAILRIELDTSNPIAKGMPKESIAWVENSPVFEVGQAFLPVRARQSLAQDQENSARERQSLSAHHGGEAAAVSNVHVIAWYPKDKDPLLSGWLLGADRIKGKAALVEVELGKGKVILFGFRPQYRGQSLATYPLFFNAITNR